VGSKSTPLITYILDGIRKGVMSWTWTRLYRLY